MENSLGKMVDGSPLNPLPKTAGKPKGAGLEI